MARCRRDFVYEIRPEFWKKKVVERGGDFFTKFVPSFEKKKWSNGGGDFFTKLVPSFEKKNWFNGGAIFLRNSSRVWRNLGRPEKICWPTKSKNSI